MIFIKYSLVEFFQANNLTKVLYFSVHHMFGQVFQIHAAALSQRVTVASVPQCFLSNIFSHKKPQTHSTKQYVLRQYILGQCFKHKGTTILIKCRLRDACDAGLRLTPTRNNCIIKRPDFSFRRPFYCVNCNVL